MVLEVPSHLAGPQKAAAGIPFEAPVPTLTPCTCLTVERLQREANLKSSYNMDLYIEKDVHSFACFFPSLLILSQTSPLSHYNLFSMLMLCTQLLCPFLPSPLFMQMISVAFLYLFSWYLPSLLHPKLISGSPCLFIEPLGWDLCLFSALFARWHLSAL